MADALIVAAITAQSGNLGESDLEPTAALRFRPTEKRTGVFKARGIKIRIRIAGIFAYFIFEAEKRSPALINLIRPLIKNCILRNLIIIRIQRISATAGKTHRDSSTTAVFESFSDATASSSTALREIGLKPPPDCHEGIPHARVAERKFDGKPVPAETIGTAAANLRAHIYAARGNLCDETVSVRIRNPKREFVFPPENCAFILPDISKRASGFSDSDDPFPEFTAPPLMATVSRLPR